MDALRWGTEALLGLAITVIGYFVRDSDKTNKEHHSRHYRHAEDNSLHESDRERQAARLGLINQLKAHEAFDDERFRQMDRRLEDVQQDVKEILRVVRREV